MSKLHDVILKFTSKPWKNGKNPSILYVVVKLSYEKNLVVFVKLTQKKTNINV